MPFLETFVVGKESVGLSYVAASSCEFVTQLLDSFWMFYAGLWSPSVGQNVASFFQSDGVATVTQNDLAFPQAFQNGCLKLMLVFITVCGEVEVLEILIANKANPNAPDIHHAYPLHYAAQMCGPNSEMGSETKVGLSVLRKLISLGADVTVTDHEGRQPLMWAAGSGSSDAILSLTSAKAPVEAIDKDGLTALHCAASRGNHDCIRTLVGLCSAEVDVTDQNGSTPLFYAVTLGHAESVSALCSLGANPNQQDRKGRTPTHFGATKGQLEALKILSVNKADLWIPNIRGDLSLHEAVHSGRKDLVRWLLTQSPSKVNVANNDGKCALHIAAITNNVEMCKVCIENQNGGSPSA